MMKYRRKKIKFGVKRLMVVILFALLAAMIVYIFYKREIIFKSSGLRRPIGRVTNEQLIFKQIAAAQIPLSSIPEIGERQIKLALEGDIEVILSTTNDLVIKLNSLQMLLDSFKIRGEMPKRIDLRYDKPVIIYDIKN